MTGIETTLPSVPLAAIHNFKTFFCGQRDKAWNIATRSAHKPEGYAQFSMLLPSIMVPSPNVTNNHQFYNGKFFQRSGACYLLEENQFSPKDFVNVLLDILNNRLVELSNNIKAMAVIDADKVIYTVVNDFVNNNKKMKQL